MKVSAVDRAYGWLRDRILDGTLAGGTFVDEAMICEGANVSRTPAREALNRLEGERFLELVPRRGARIREFSLSDLQDAYRARQMIESYAVQEFCASRRPIPREMLEARDSMDELAASRDTVTRLAYKEANQHFHTTLVRTLQNQPILEFFESLLRINSLSMWVDLYSSDRDEWSLTESFVEQNLREHHAIIDALEIHDAETAIRILKDHLQVRTSPAASR
jgi:DNA-binding GntR family transcriptional regulator